MCKFSKGLQFRVDQIVLTTGHTRKVRPQLYTQPWASSSDFMLVGDIIEACHVRNLDDQGIELKHCIQAGQCNTAASVLEHPWFPGRLVSYETN